MPRVQFDGKATVRGDTDAMSYLYLLGNFARVVFNERTHPRRIEVLRRAPKNAGLPHHLTEQFATRSLLGGHNDCLGWVRRSGMILKPGLQSEPSDLSEMWMPIFSGFGTILQLCKQTWDQDCHARYLSYCWQLTCPRETSAHQETHLSALLRSGHPRALPGRRRVSRCTSRPGPGTRRPTQRQSKVVHQEKFRTARLPGQFWMIFKETKIDPLDNGFGKVWQYKFLNMHIPIQLPKLNTRVRFPSPAPKSLITSSRAPPSNCAPPAMLPAIRRRWEAGWCRSSAPRRVRQSVRRAGGSSSGAA